MSMTVSGFYSVSLFCYIEHMYFNQGIGIELRYMRRPALYYKSAMNHYGDQIPNTK